MSDDIDDLLDDDEETPEPEKRDKDTAPTPPYSVAWAKMRKEAKEAAKRAEAAEAQLKEYQAKERTQSVSGTFTALGLSLKHAKFYPADAETTPEAVKQWAVSEDFLKVEEGEEADNTPPPETGFTPTVIAEAQVIGSKMYTDEEFAALLRQDPKKAEAVYRSGRLKKEEPDWTYSSRLYGRDT